MHIDVLSCPTTIDAKSISWLAFSWRFSVGPYWWTCTNASLRNLAAIHIIFYIVFTPIPSSCLSNKICKWEEYKSCSCIWMYIWRKVEVTVYRVHPYLCHLASAARWTRWLDLRESIQLYSTAWGSFLPEDSTLKIEDGSECFSPSTTSSLCSCKSAKHHIHVSRVKKLIQPSSSDTF